MSKAITRDIEVSVLPAYLSARSKPEQADYFFMYQVKIFNRGEVAVQLLNRHWDIVDGDGKQQTVDGPGVVGEQPLIEPGESYEYASACPLTTPQGSMAGHYEMQTSQGDRFNAEIAAFQLNAELALN